MTLRIPFLRPEMPPIESWTRYLTESYGAAWFTNFGPLERRFAEACVARYASPGYEVVTASNATAALTAALLGVRNSAVERPRVVLPSFTFPATLHAVLQAGCVATLCDSDPVTWEMDIGALAEILERETVDVVMPVRSYGFVRDQTALIALAQRHGCQVIVDGAAAFGHPGRIGAIGSRAGEIEVVSLHATKPFAVGEGGLIFAPSEAAAAIRCVTNFGLAPPDSFGEGGNMKFDEIHAAVGLAMLERIDALVGQRVSIARRYDEIVGDQFPALQHGVEVGPTPWQCYPLLFQNHVAAARAADRLAENGIATRRYYRPTLRSGFSGRRTDFKNERPTPIADDLSSRMICLPLYSGLPSGDIDFLMETVSAIVRSA